MNIFHTIILGIIEGVTEFLPISSTAHLEITQNLLGIMTTEFTKSFEIAIQLGAIFAVVFFYRKKLLASSFLYYRNIAIAFIPTGIIGFVLYKIIKSFLLGNISIAITMLFLGGLFIIFYERRVAKSNQDAVLDLHKQTIETLSVKQLITIGTAQALAVVPGVSRSGAVIISGRMMGLPRELITEFSFVLAIPTMLAATAYDLLKSGFSFSYSLWGNIFLGMVVSFIIALIVIKWFLNYVQKHSFSVFGWYRVIFAILLIFLYVFIW